MTNAREHNDVRVSIKVQQFRSRYAKYVIIVFVFCVNATAKKSDLEPGRVPVKMLNRLSKESRKLQSYVPCRLIKNVPKSSKYIDIRKNCTHKTSLRFKQKMRKKPIFRRKKETLTVQSKYGYNEVEIIIERNISNS